LLSSAVLNLATALAERGARRVLVIEADLHRPSLADSLGITASPGLAECIEAGLDPLSRIQRIEPLQWYLMHAGHPTVNPSDLMHSPALQGVMEKLAAYFDWILMDTPPVAPLSDALSLSQVADASLLVVRADRTPRESVEDAIALLGPNRLAGIVFNGAESLNRLYSKYSGYYHHKDA
jgi:Mrp family chromosome partitioning ATPase